MTKRMTLARMHGKWIFKAYCSGLDEYVIKTNDFRQIAIFLMMNHKSFFEEIES